MKKLFCLIAIILVAIIFTGCGTTEKVTDDDNDDKVVVQEITPALESSLVTLNNAVFPNDDYVQSTDPYAAVANALIEVYSGYPYTADKFLGKATSAANGTFEVNIGNDDVSVQVLYVVQTAQGKRMSNAVIINK